LLLPFDSYQLSLTPALVGVVFGNKLTDEMLVDEAKYIKFSDGNYWIPSGTQILDPDNFYQVSSMTDPFGNNTVIRHDSLYNFYIDRITDELQNETALTGFNFRTLTPYLMTDLNNNRSGLRMDELGMVVSSFLMGKDGEAKGDFMDTSAIEASLADQPTSKFEYDFFSYANTGKPNFIKTFIRDTHHFESLQEGIPVNWQVTYSYADGGGSEVMQKVQAEPGIALQENEDGTVTEVNTGTEIRWIGNGRTILNNKGSVVKLYEPYFSISHEYEDSKLLVERGVTPIFHYDPVGRITKTLLPDGTFVKQEIDSWMGKSFDQNDTVLESEWYKNRILSPVPEIATAEEIDAATKAFAHNNTPTLNYKDSLGRNFIHVADNAGAGKYKTITITDIEGNLKEITDARGNIPIQYKHDMLGNILYQRSMDDGERWMITNVMGNRMRSWDNRAVEFTFAYDRLQRPVSKHIKGGDGVQPLDHVYERILYGEELPDNQLKNLRGKPVIVYNTSGKTQTIDFDFKGNALHAETRLLENYKDVIHWDESDPDTALETEALLSSVQYDALDRIIQQTSPDNSIYQPRYNEGGLLEKVFITQGGTTSEFVKKIDYNEKGQRSRIVYGNDVSTTYNYDEKSFRLVHLQSRKINNTLLQDLYYTFDPVGNVTQVKDNAIPDVFFNNQFIQAVSSFTYDAIYQLIEASGREHAGQLTTGVEDNWNDLPFLQKKAPNSPLQWRNYTEQYQYDPTGNLLQLKHIAGGGSWTRNYKPDTQTNRLLSTEVGSDIYNYSHHLQHGFITSMPHLEVMQWNFKEELQAIARQRLTQGTPETTFFQYDGSGMRARKITERQAAAGTIPAKKSERIYIGWIEIYREYDHSNNVNLERKTCHVSDNFGLIAMIETRTIGTDESPAKLVRYQFHNQLGSTCIETDDNARVISYEEYHPYGTTSYQAGDSEIKAANKRYRYSGMERDEESGLNYHNARYYIPWLGRWLNGDPSGVAAGINLFQYCFNNPVSKTDTAGKEPTINSLEDIFTLIRNTAAFTSGKTRPVNYSSGNASPNGTAYHKQATSTLTDVQNAGICRANQVYSEVAINKSTGVVTQIGGSPIRGHHNLDLVGMPDGSPRLVPNQSTMTPGSAEAVSDIKYGAGKISTAHSIFGQRAITTNSSPLSNKSTIATPEIDFSVDPVPLKTSPVVKSTPTIRNIPAINNTQAAREMAAEMGQSAKFASRTASFTKGVKIGGGVLQLWEIYQYSELIDNVKEWGEGYKKERDAMYEQVRKMWGWDEDSSAEPAVEEPVYIPPPPKPKKNRADEAREAFKALGQQYAMARARANTAPANVPDNASGESSGGGSGSLNEMVMNPYWTPTNLPWGPQPMWVPRGYRPY
jgi:RHS repeat-associated protein